MHDAPTIGHNSKHSLASAAEANIHTGVLLLCKEALVTAIQDRRLERGHLRVLAAIATCLNVRTAKAWPGRAAIATMTGMSVRAVSNTLLELRNWNYLIAEREAVEQANGKKLTVYTFGNIDHDTIRREIAEFCARMRGAEKSPPTVNPEVTAHGDSHRPRGLSTSPPTVNSPEKVTAHGAGKSPPTVDSNSIKELNKKESADAPVQLQDLIWTKGLEYLRTSYAGAIAEEKLRQRLGRMIQEHGSGNVLDALGKAQRNGTTVDPLSYMQGIMRRGGASYGAPRKPKISRW